MAVFIEDGYHELNVQPKLQGGQDGLKYKMYSAGPALKIGPEVKIDGVRVNCGKFTMEGGYEGSHLEMVPLPKQVLNMVMRKWRAENPDDFNTYMNNPAEESALFNESASLKKVWSNVAQTAFGPKSSRFWIGGPDQCKMAGAGMYGWRVARLRNLPRPHKPQEEKEEEEEEEEAGGEEVNEQLAQKDAEIASLKAQIDSTQEFCNRELEKLDVQLGDMDQKRDYLKQLLRYLETKAVNKCGQGFFTEEQYGVIGRRPRWDRLQNIVYGEENGVETFTFTFTAQPAGALVAQPAGALVAQAQPQAQPAGALVSADLKKYREAFNGGFGMKVENQSVNHIVPNKDAVLEKVGYNPQYQSLLKETTSNPLERMIQLGALVQDAIILPWSVVTKIVKGMNPKMFFTACSKQGETRNRVLDRGGADVLLGYTEQGKEGWDIYGVLSLTGIVQTVNNALNNTFEQTVPAKNVLAFISCRSAEVMAQTLALNKVDLPAFEPWAGVVKSGEVKDKDKIYEVDTVCSRSVGKKRLGQLLMLWALSKQLNSAYYGTALKVVKLAQTAREEGVTYHGPPDIEVANLYHNLFKYQRAFPFPPVGDPWHQRWTEEILGYKSTNDVGANYWKNAKSFFDPTQPPPYTTTGYTAGAQDPNVVKDADSPYNREEYWMYRPYPTDEQLETIATYVLDKIVAPPPAPAAAARLSRNK